MTAEVLFRRSLQARYGWPCHVLFTIYFLACAHIVTGECRPGPVLAVATPPLTRPLLSTGSLVLGCSATINALTGANIIATNFLLPIGIAVYVRTLLSSPVRFRT